MRMLATSVITDSEKSVSMEKYRETLKEIQEEVQKKAANRF
jgi:hypothetical protein